MTSTAPLDFNALSEAEQREVAERLLKIEQSGWRPFWCPDAGCNGMPHTLMDDQGYEMFVEDTAMNGPNGEPVGNVVTLVDGSEARPVLDPRWSHNHARVDQRLPSWRKPWTLFIMSGRGSGKTTTGTEFVTLCARKGLDGAILGRRGTELVNTHVATIIARAHPDFKPVHFASKDILVWPEVTKADGTKVTPTTYLFSAEKPENIRSVNLSYAWVDEAAFMDEIETAWMNLQLATRVEDPHNPIHTLITSTPQPTQWTMDMEDDPDVIVRRVSTYANKANLSDDFLRILEKNYEGTRMGRQELEGEVLRDVEGAMWNDDMFRHHRTDALGYQDYLDSLDNRVLAVDPAGSKGKRSDATGIIGVGTHLFDDDGERLSTNTFTVLGDATIKGTPTEWAAQTFKAARLWRVTKIVAEKNFGGDMVKQVLTDYAALHPETCKDENGDDYKIEVVRASASKETRAEATVGKYEQGRVTHLTAPVSFGDLAEMEKEQVTWVPKSRGGKSPSPNRVDALVWAVRDLEQNVRYEAQTATYANVRAALGKGPATPPGALNRRGSQAVTVPTATRQQAPAHERPRKVFRVKVRPVD